MDKKQNETPPLSSKIALLIEKHSKLLSMGEHQEAKRLLQDALLDAYEESAVSLDVISLLDALALGCKEIEEFREASIYLAQSLALKKMIYGPRNEEIVTAMRRLMFCVEGERSFALRIATKKLARELGLQDVLSQSLERYLIDPADFQHLGFLDADSDH